VKCAKSNPISFVLFLGLVMFFCVALLQAVFLTTTDAPSIFWVMYAYLFVSWFAMHLVEKKQ
jgi:hypothetical protein